METPSFESNSQQAEPNSEIVSLLKNLPDDRKENLRSILEDYNEITEKIEELEDQIEAIDQSVEHILPNEEERQFLNEDLDSIDDEVLKKEISVGRDAQDIRETLKMLKDEVAMKELKKSRIKDLRDKKKSQLDNIKRGWPKINKILQKQKN